jgi:small-conductance mechanosensitive channel
MSRQVRITLGVIVELILARVLTPYINSFIANKVVGLITIIARPAQ